MARFIREGCEARASYSVGRALTGKYCTVLAENPRTVASSYLVQSLSIAIMSLVNLLEILDDFPEVLLYGIL